MAAIRSIERHSTAGFAAVIAIDVSAGRVMSSVSRGKGNPDTPSDCASDAWMDMAA
jgi:hypothetical protein